ncbi:heparinase [Mucilaginibacter pedocola]|uniref:Heparinase n=1 Tax=Mucilaginibacter pedocola TaxID=1792845 RepID=A0A1S9P8C4_9SPHI|nr:heparinase [Mucilaginibacter pedocola]
MFTGKHKKASEQVFTIDDQTDHIGNIQVPDHPRLLLLAGEEKKLENNIREDKGLSRVNQLIFAGCRAILNKPLISTKNASNNKFDPKREGIRRMFFLSYAWRMTKEKKYLDRAIEEMLNVSAFEDWNPKVYLDVAEMTTAVSIAYDWLYNDIPDTYRMIIKKAILKKGIEPSLNPLYNSWLTKNTNWNQVCNSAMIYGALAIYEDDPEFAKKIINRSLSSLPLAMAVYKPEGAYPEGFGYYCFGTTFNVLAITALQSAFKTDFGLSKSSGFLESAKYAQNAVGTSDIAFNYSDANDVEDVSSTGLLYWFSNQTADKSLLWVERNKIMTYPDKTFISYRFLPTWLIWGSNVRLDNVTEPKINAWKGNGENSVAMMRSSWTNPNAIYVGLKAGSGQNSHSHLDAGSFVMDADGQRWAIDFGKENYGVLSAKGIDLADYSQESNRWSVFRNNNFSHNTLTIDSALQNATGNATIANLTTNKDFLSATTDLSEIYSGHVASAKRGIAIVDQNHVVVRDEIKSLNKATTIRWNMVTAASVKILSKNKAELTLNGKTLYLEVAESANITLKTWPTYSHNTYEMRNPGTIFIGFDISLPANSKIDLSVTLTPGSTANKVFQPVKPLSEWGK